MVESTENAPRAAKCKVYRKGFVLLVYADVRSVNTNDVAHPLELRQLVLIVSEKGDAHAAILLLSGGQREIRLVVHCWVNNFE